MAAQVVSVVGEETGQSPRRVTYTIVLEDNEGTQTSHQVGPMTIGDSDDANAIGQQKADQLLSQKQEQEEVELPQEHYDESINPLTFTLNAKFSSDKKIAKKLIRWMMRERDPRIVIWLEPLIQYLRDNFTARQIANFLDITTEQVIKLNQRVNTILEQSGVVKAQIILFDSYREDIEE